MNNQMLTPRRPHILLAFYEWLVENDLTPHLVVDATLPMVEVPQEYVKDGQIVLNIAPCAVADFFIENHQIHFKARFSGESMTICVPMYAVMAIYARENGAGTMFEPEQNYEIELEELENKTNSSAPVIGLVEVDAAAEADTEDTEALEAKSDDADESTVASKAEKKPKKKGPPSLTVVK